MHGIPKIVLERLKRKPMADQQDRQSTIDDRPSPHPDANLLAAFVEKALTERERTQVLNHLAQCADCRELAALTLPAEVAVAEPTRWRARRGWSIRPVLRWGALATALGAVAIFVAVHPYSRKRQAIAGRPAGAETKQQVPLMAEASPPAARETKSIRTPSRVREMPKGERLTSVGAMHAAPSPAKPAFEPPAARVATSNAPAGPLAGGGATTQSVNVEASPVSKDLGAAQASVELAQSRAPTPRPLPLPSSGGGGAGSAAAGAFARRKTEQARVSGMAFRAGSAIAAPQPAALWTISPEGKLQRSNDRGNTWKEVPVDDKVTFRVIRALGREVWAGGSGGALYHSNDGGATWTRITLTSGASPTTETIVSIVVSPPALQRITIRTAAGGQWTTEDGGQHWKAVTSDE